ncbi:MAG TPA: acyl-CoA reductase, partial [Polyangiales bacterium]
SGPLRVSPGYRNLQVLALPDASQLAPRLAPLGVHLKALGVAGVPDLRAFASTLPARTAPRVCPLGQMQTPPHDASHDALPPYEGLLRWIDVG